MNKVPIAFAFDRNLVFPACVCMSSLLMSARPDTFYEIYILHSSKENLPVEEFEKLTSWFSNCSIVFRGVGDIFDKAFQIRGITTPAYYRLLIPNLIPEHDKIIYSDVDVIFRRDLQEVYAVDLGEKYLAATYDMGINLSQDGMKYINSVDGLQVGEYIQSGFIILNNRKIEKDNLLDSFKSLSSKSLRYQDQDILNIVCRDNILVLPFTYNMTDQAYYYITYERERLDSKYLNDDYTLAHINSIIHYNGYKPWKSYCVNFDIWWEYYRKSPYFDSRFYFDFFYKKLDEYDRLPFMKRVKILIRYFFFRK